MVFYTDLHVGSSILIDWDSTSPSVEEKVDYFKNYCKQNLRDTL